MGERLRGGLVHRRRIGGLSRGHCDLGLDELALNDKGPRRRLCSPHKTRLRFVRLLYKVAHTG